MQNLIIKYLLTFAFIGLIGQGHSMRKVSRAILQLMSYGFTLALGFFTGIVTNIVSNFNASNTKKLSDTEVVERPESLLQSFGPNPNSLGPAASTSLIKDQIPNPLALSDFKQNTFGEEKFRLEIIQDPRLRLLSTTKLEKPVRALIVARLIDEQLTSTLTGNYIVLTNIRYGGHKQVQPDSLEHFTTFAVGLNDELISDLSELTGRVLENKRHLVEKSKTRFYNKYIGVVTKREYKISEHMPISPGPIIFTILIGIGSIIIVVHTTVKRQMGDLKNKLTEQFSKNVNINISSDISENLFSDFTNKKSSIDKAYKDDLYLTLSQIENGKIEDALDGISKRFVNANWDIKNQIIHLQSRFNQLKSEINSGVIKYEDFRIERNKITMQLLELVRITENEAT